MDALWALSGGLVLTRPRPFHLWGSKALIIQETLEDCWEPNLRIWQNRGINDQGLGSESSPQRDVEPPMDEQRAFRTAQIVASIAHDLRNPLNAVIGFSRVMLKGIDGPLSDMQAADLEAIHANGTVMLEMIEDIIDLAKMEAGQLAPNPTVFRLEPLLERAKSLTVPAERDRRIEVFSANEGLPPIWADRAHIEKAFTRTIAAATALDPSGTISIRSAPHKRFIATAIACSASKGLTPDALSVLEAYRSSGASPEQRVTRTGLQLLVSEQLVALNGGRFCIRDLAGTELAFQIDVPVAPGR
jgi:signal transduction histidine kinase